MRLTKNSKYLILFFKNSNHIIDIPSDYNINTILKDIYDMILESHSYLISHPIKYSVKINKIDFIKPFSNFDSIFFPKQIKEHIFKNSSFEIVYEFTIFDRQIRTIFIIDNKEYPTLDKYDQYIKKITMWLYILKFQSPNKCSKILTIYLYLTDFQKQLPTVNTDILSALHVNSAFTTSCSENAEIIIYRKEEWFKVFIHESFHSFGLDFSGMNNSRVTKYIKNIFRVKSKVNLFESYTECWAEIINLLFCSFYILKDKNDLDNFISNFNTLISYEISYSLFQLVKTLNYQNMNYNDLLFSTDKIKLYRENSNILAYYIIKTILIVNYQQFLLWCNQNNEKLFQFNKTVNTLNDFCQFVKNNHNSDRLKIAIQNMENIFNKIINSNNKYLLSNMRMTICEMH
jgi:hypothetical protein